MTKLGVAVAFALSMFAASSLSQDNPNLEEGIKPYGDFHGGNIDKIDLGSGGLTVAIPIKSFPQRGNLTLPVTLRYNSKLWSNKKACGANGSCLSSYWVYGDRQVMQSGSGNANELYGLNGLYNTLSSPVYVTYTDDASVGCGWRYAYQSQSGTDSSGKPIYTQNYSTVDCTAYSSDGAAHVMAPLYNQLVAITYQLSQATPVVNITSLPYETIDGSGIYATAAIGNLGTAPGSSIVAAGYFALNPDGDYSQGDISEDSDGNYIDAAHIVSGNALRTTLTDSRGLQISELHADPGINGEISNCDTSDPIYAVNTWTTVGQNGAPETYTFCYTELHLSTNFPQYPGTTMNQFKNGSNNNIFALHSVALPTGEKWIFEYDSYADLTRIEFPTGASLAYSYDTYPLCDLGNIKSSAEIAAFMETYSWTPYSRFVTSRTLDANDGNGPQQWTYTWGSEVVSADSRQFNVTVRDPQGNETVHTETGLSNSCSFYETSSKAYQGSAASNVLLGQTDTAYSSALSPANNASWATAGIIDAVNVVPTSITTTTPTGAGYNLVKRVEMDYDYPFQYYYTQSSGIVAGPFQGTYGDISQKREFDYGANGPGGLLRKTLTNYQYDLNAAYARRPGLVASTEVQDGAGNRVAYTQYGYDEFARTPSGITTHIWDAILGNTADNQYLTALPSLKMHQTSTTKAVIYWDATIRSCNVYFDTGMLASTSDWLSTATNCSGANWTTFSYDSSYAGAYRTKTQKPTTTNGVNHIVSGTYDFASGLLTSFTDENGVVSKYTYSDSLNRMTLAQRASGTPTERWIQLSYPTLREINIASDQSAKGDEAIKKGKVFDGVGKILMDQIASDTSSGGTITTDTTYDILGRVSSVSTPYRAKSESTYSLDITQYDGSGRVVKEYKLGIPGVKWTCYDGKNLAGQPNCNQKASGTAIGSWTDSQDENGNDRQSVTDALGRLAYVVEPTGSNSSPLITQYAYDLEDNLIRASQSGNGTSDIPRNRYFVFDGLSRLISANNPETGNVCYGIPNSGNRCVLGYDGNGNLLARTDSRGTVRFSYDSLNRLLSKSYNDGITPVSCYQYDSTAVANGVGRLSAAWTQPNGTSCPATAPSSGALTMKVIGAYDAMGRVVSEQQCVQGFCTSASPPASPSPNCSSLSSAIGLQYCYDLAGNLTAYSNGLSAGAFPQQAMSFSQQFDTANRLSSVSNSAFSGTAWNNATHPSNLLTLDPSLGYTSFAAPQNWTLGANMAGVRSYDNHLRMTSGKVAKSQ